MTSAWPSTTYDTDSGDPEGLRRGPDPAVVKVAGCPKAAKALQHAVALRDEYVSLRGELRDRDRALAEAKAADAAEHAQALDGKLEPRHLAEAERRFDELARRKDALAVAVPNALDAVVEALESERESATLDLAERRAAILARMGDAVAEIHDAFAQLQVMYDAAGWVQEWPARRWRRPLAPQGASKIGMHRDLTVGDLVAAADELVVALGGLVLPGQEVEPPRVVFGRSQLGVMPAAADAQFIGR